MGDVLMIKNNSGVKSATGLTGSGTRDWMVQRISAIVLAVYSIVLLGFFLTHGDVTFLEWSSFMYSLPMRLFSLVAILALAGHAWVGMWTVFTDYITSGKMGESATKLRMVLQTFMILAILVYLFWGIMIFYVLRFCGNEKNNFNCKYNFMKHELLFIKYHHDHNEHSAFLQKFHDITRGRIHPFSKRLRIYGKG